MNIFILNQFLIKQEKIYSIFWLTNYYINYNMKKTYLVTGGQGFIGKAVSISLLEKNQNVVIFDNNFREKKFYLKHKNFKMIKGDIRKKNDLNKIKK